MDRINDQSVQNIINCLQREHYAYKTMRNWVVLINSVLITEHYPAVKVILPPKQVIDRQVPTPGEIRMIQCLLHGHRLEIPFQLALLGLRRGEICALTLEDLDRQDVLHIHRTLVKDDDNFLILKDSPKTDASNRYVQLSHSLAEQIRKKGKFTDYTPNGISSAYRHFLGKYRFPPYRFHDCRHFFASFCHEQGIAEADILAGGGWKTANVMRSVYRHAMAKNAASARISALLTTR